MKTISRIFFLIGIVWILLCLFILTIGQYLPFRFSNDNSAETFHLLVWLTFPIAVLLTLLPNGKVTNRRPFKALKIIVAVASFLFFSVYVFGKTMCGYTTDDILFVNKADTALKISKRHYNCGAYDSDLPNYEFYKVKSLTTQILYSQQVDTTQLDKSEWTRMKSSKTYNHR